MGLLAASERTDGGHRMYDRESIQRVHQIRALRDLDFSLEEIRKAMNGRTSLTDLLRKHLERIEVKVARTTQLRDRLRNMTTDGDAQVSVDELPATLNAMSMVEKPPPPRPCTCALAADGEERWRSIRDELRDCMDREEHPCSDRTKAVALKARVLIKEFAGIDSTVSTVLNVLARLCNSRILAGWDPHLMLYLDRALVALEDQPH
ncbi:nodulation protein NolA [Bradyrhizobium sp. NAS80.1]|nr:nodulation protein NolA [Bradyrhizobium sp. NAS80.1]OKO80499.1 nodulation protein NolA [Bradyrhizobium sp. AS23.2]